MGKNMNILVTGGNGFIGSHLVKALAATGHHHVVVLDLYPLPSDALPANVVFIQANLTDYSLVRQIIEDHGIELVYHLAWATIHETSLKDPSADVHTNLITSIKLLDICRDAGVKRVIFLSSGGTVYGIPQIVPTPEEHPTNPICAYGITKLAVEKYLYLHAHLYGLEYVILRPSVPYGPRQNPHRRQGAVAVFLYHALRGQPVTIWGNGDVVRDYFYIADLIQAMLMVQTVRVGEYPIFNLGGGQGYTLNELIQVIEDVLGCTIQTQYYVSRKFDVPQLQLDCRKAAAQLGWQPATPLTEGIRKTVTWFEQIHG
jgi:UDP-glucose 4-epimerase